MTTKPKPLPEIPKIKLPIFGWVDGQLNCVCGDYYVSWFNERQTHNGPWGKIDGPARKTERGAILAARKALGVKP